MRVQFLLAPAGYGKTHRCLTEVRETLRQAQDGPPLLFLAPKQATFQIERQLLAVPDLAGFSRLRILSFPRLASALLNDSPSSLPTLSTLLSTEGRIMILRAILESRRDQLQIFRAGARLRGFSRHLSEFLQFCQENRLGPQRLRTLAAANPLREDLRAKLADAALLLEGYLDWLDRHRLQDPEKLLELAAEAPGLAAGSTPLYGHLWMDGFAEMTPGELELLAAVLRRCHSATLAFCIDHTPDAPPAWLSPWSVIGDTFHRCHQRLSAVPGMTLTVELAGRDGPSRFSGNAVLQHLEAHWVRPRPAAWIGPSDASGQPSFNLTPPDPGPTLRLCEADHPELEAEVAADEILSHVSSGGRFRDTAVLARRLEPVAAIYLRVFRRRGIPCFVDQRIPVSHHPQVEQTRNALRAIVHEWNSEDLLASVKAGRVSDEADRLADVENAARASGRMGARWLEPLPTEFPGWMEDLKAQWTRPLCALAERLRGDPSGRAFANALRAFWGDLGWSPSHRPRRGIPRAGVPADDPGLREDDAVESALNAWIADLERALGDVRLTAADWMSVVESGLSGLTVGVVPPMLDQVLLGAIDRSRNPDLALVILPGWNDGAFPLPAPSGGLLSDADRDALAAAGIAAANSRRHIGHERFYAYVALTRSRRRVVVTWSRLDAAGEPLAPSPFVRDLRKLFPGLVPDPIVEPSGPHRSEGADPMPAMRLVPQVVEALYGTSLHSSVSRLEQFAACPFRFFAVSGLHLKDREAFELDPRERGSFLHDVLEAFHLAVLASGRRWRDLNDEAISIELDQSAKRISEHFRFGLLDASPSHRFTAARLVGELKELLKATVRWMQRHPFDPVAVEVPFGMEAASAPAWRLELSGARCLELRGRIDRIDAWTDPRTGIRWIVVLDYKSSPRKFEPRLFRNGLQVQLPAYLTVAASRPLQTPDPSEPGPVPGGMVYVPLRASSASRIDRGTPSADTGSGWLHRGRLSAEIAGVLEPPEAPGPLQFNVHRKKDGSFAARSDVVDDAGLHEVLGETQGILRALGEAILDGQVEAAPYRHAGRTACDYCEYRSVCRFDPGQGTFRSLRP